VEQKTETWACLGFPVLGFSSGARVSARHLGPYPHAVNYFGFEPTGAGWVRMITAPSMYPPVTTGTRGIFAILSIVLFGAGTFDGVFVSVLIAALLA
jgi:hypothetical protein